MAPSRLMSIFTLNIAAREEGCRLIFVTRELFVLFNGFTIPLQATEQWVDAGLEKFSKMRVRSRLIPAMSGCDWKTDVLDLARKSWDDACPTVRRSPSVAERRKSHPTARPPQHSPVAEVRRAILWVCD